MNGGWRRGIIINVPPAPLQTELRLMKTRAITAHEHDVDVSKKSIRGLIQSLAEAGVLRQSAEHNGVWLFELGGVAGYVRRQVHAKAVGACLRAGFNSRQPQFLMRLELRQEASRAGYQDQGQDRNNPLL